MSKKIHITIPIYLTDPLHVEFTQKTLDSIQTKHNYTTSIIINHALPKFQPFINQIKKSPHTTTIKNPQGNSLSAAWNLGIKQGFKEKADYIAILNNDIILHPDCLDNLVKFAQKSDYILWSASEWSNMRTLNNATMTNSHSPHPHFSAFMLNQNTIDTTGFFDENLVVYFEDNDYHTRILLAREKAGATDSAKFYHFGSRTTSVDDELRSITKRSYEKNRDYMLKKWGLDFHAQGFSPPEKILKKVFKTPFNDPNKAIKDW